MKRGKCYNNGIVNKYIKDGEPIPEGFVLGGKPSTRSKEEIQRIAEKSRQTQKISWANKSEEEKKQFSNNCKKVQLNRSIESKQASKDKYLKYWNNLTDEEREQINDKRRKSVRAYWDAKTEEERKEFARKNIENGAGWNFETITNTVINKYGVNNVSKLDEVKEKVKETMRMTSQERYGTDNPLQAKLVRELAKDSLEAHYGVRSPGSSTEIREKIQNTFLEKYGHTYSWNFETIRKNNLEKYGFEWNCQLPQCNNAIGAKGSNTKPNLEFSKLLTKHGISFEREKSIGKFSYDFILDNNTIIEINPFATHNSTWGLFDKTKGVSKDYHKIKSMVAKEAGYRCIHVWDWDNKEKIIESLKTSTVVYARQCDIKLVSIKDSDSFLNIFHFQNTCKGQIIRLGLYYKDELIMLMTFGKSRYNKSYEYELLRLCTKFGFRIVGGAKKLFTYFINNFKPKSIISYCDNSKFIGNVYSDLGFELISDSIPSRHWYNDKYKLHVTDNLLRQLGFDRLFGDIFSCYGLGTSNEQLMLEHGFVEIYDAGQSTYKIILGDNA